MSKRHDRAFLLDILDAIRLTGEFIEGLDYDAFLADKKSQAAVIRNLEVIGEATKRLSWNLRNSHPEVPWKEMAGLRDRLIHDYFGVNIDVVWQVVSDELDQVGAEIGRMLEIESE